MPEENLYTLLGLRPDANPEVIKAACRALMQSWHTLPEPERSQKLAHIKRAWTILTNATLRAEYDAMLAAKEQWQTAAAPLQPAQPAVSHHPAQAKPVDDTKNAGSVARFVSRMLDIEVTGGIVLFTLAFSIPEFSKTISGMDTYLIAMLGIWIGLIADCIVYGIFGNTLF